MMGPGASQADDAERQREHDRNDVEQRRRGEHHRSLSAAAVHQAILVEGREELSRPTSALAFSGLAAGLSMGFSLVAEGLLRAHLPDEPWRPAVAKLGYSAGFLFVNLGRQQLYTEMTLTAVLPVLETPGRTRLLRLLRVWSVVIAANLVGALLFAWATVSTGAFSPEARQAFLELGVEAARPDFLTAGIKGVYAGWLIAVMVWFLPAATGSKPFVIVAVTYLVGLGQLTHIVAGSAEVLYAVLAGALPWTTYLWRYALPTLIGNTLGGVLLVAALNHAQAVVGSSDKNG